MPSIIPTSFDPERPYYRQTTTIEGREYQLEFRYSGREESWYLSLYKLEADETRTPLATGVKIVPRIDLLRRFTRGDRLPPGELRAIPRGADGSLPGLSDLGEAQRVELVYYDSTEL
jgi:hypothetical protein